MIEDDVLDDIEDVDYEDPVAKSAKNPFCLIACLMFAALVICGLTYAAINASISSTSTSSSSAKTNIQLHTSNFLASTVKNRVPKNSIAHVNVAPKSSTSPLKAQHHPPSRIAIVWIWLGFLFIDIYWYLGFFCCFGSVVFPFLVLLFFHLCVQYMYIWHQVYSVCCQFLVPVHIIHLLYFVCWLGVTYNNIVCSDCCVFVFVFVFVYVFHYMLSYQDVSESCTHPCPWFCFNL